MRAPPAEVSPAIGDRVPLSAIARHWGAEIGRHPDVLARGLIAAYADGEFDDLPGGSALVCFDPDSLQITAVTSKDWARDLVTPYKTREGRKLDPLGYLAVARTGVLRISPVAVATFANRRGLALPSWMQPARDTEPPKAAIPCKGGRPPKYDWVAVAAALEEECKLQESVPHPGHSDKDWRLPADAVRFLRERFAKEWPNGGPADSQLRKTVKEILANIQAKMPGAKN